MKKYISTLSLFACAVAGSFAEEASSTEYTFVLPNEINTTAWADVAWMNGTTPATWAEISENGVCTDKLILDMKNVSAFGNSTTLNFSSEITLSSLKILQKNNRVLALDGDGTNTLKITTLDINSFDGNGNMSAPKIGFRNMNLEIGTINSDATALAFGGYHSGGGNSGDFAESRLKSLTIGNINWSAGASNPSQRAYTFISADAASVTGLITGPTSGTSNFIALTNGTNLSVGGIDGIVDFTSIATENLKSTLNVLELKNSQTLENNGDIIECKVFKDTSSSDKISNALTDYTQAKFALKMNAATATEGQKFNSQTLFFSGGVEVVSGVLSLNFNQKTDNYYYASNLENGATYRDSYKWTDYTRKEFTTTQKYDESGSAPLNEDADTKTTASHGDLVMKGGVFENTRTSSDGNQSFRFTNIDYQAGTIKLVLEDGASDYLDLTGYYIRESSAVHASGTENIITLSGFKYTEVAGGTVNVAEGTKLTFDFGDSIDWLVDYENEETGKKGVLVIAWSADQGELSADDFTTVSSLDGYKAEFNLYDDGLYVRYVAVPEPSEYAAMFGALALAFVLYRRRK